MTLEPQTSFEVTEKGFYGHFGGAFIPEMLYPNVEELRQNYLSIMADPAFQAEFWHLLTDFVGRPTPLFLAKRLSAQVGATVYLKREDLCHTGAPTCAESRLARNNGVGRPTKSVSRCQNSDRKSVV